MKIAPEFELDGQPLKGLLNKGPVLLVFFKISCPTCQLALPYLNRMKDGSLQIVTISQDDAESTTEFNESFQLSMSTLLDPEDAGYPVSNAYGITHVPSLFLIEPDGIVGISVSGFVKREMEEIGARCGIAPFGPDDSVPAWKAG
jgi:peroxiredoxin